MRFLSAIVLATLLSTACSSTSNPADTSVGDAPSTTDGLSQPDQADTATPPDVADVTVPPDATDATVAPDAPDGTVEPDSGTEEVQPEVVEPAYRTVDEVFLDSLEPACESCYIVSHDSWDGAAEVSFPTKGSYDQPYEGAMLYLKPYQRFRMPHPGRVTRIFVYTGEAAGSIRLSLSTGFPGGHYPCLDESTGKDPYPVGKPYLMEVSDKPGWRVFSVGKLDWHLLGYDEFFVFFEQEGEARVGLAQPAPTFPGDYPAYGGIIGDIPGDQMKCFPTMSAFTDAEEKPLVWLVRAEIEADEVVEKHEFEDMGIEKLNVGGHVAFADFDNDADEDFLCGGILWSNDGKGSFANVSEAAGLTGLGGETVWGDYDNDGHRDILGVGGQPFLFHNNGDGTFTNVTADSGIAINASSQGVVWFDLDGDTFLDFYAASYGKLEDPEKATRDYLFRNNGDGTFTDMTEALGIPVKPLFYHGRGVCTADYDVDGDPDVYVGNYRLDPNQLWNNQGGMKGFKNVAPEAGVAGIFEQGSYGHTIGPSFGDLDGDGLFDLVVPNLAHPRFFEFSDPTTLYFNNGDGTFAGFEPPEKGILYDETHSDSVLFDADADGDLDLFLTSVYEGRRSFLYYNDGTGAFTDRTYQAGILHLNGWGAAAADVDGDLDVDLVANRLFLNQDPGNGHHLAVRLVGGAAPGKTEGVSNRDAIGAVVTAKLTDRTLVRQVEGGTGVGCQNSGVLHFGLGAVKTVPELIVTWPSGKVTTLKDVAADKLLVVQEIAP